MNNVDSKCFGLAIEAAKQGFKIQRQEWVSTGWFVFREPNVPGYGSVFTMNTGNGCFPWVPNHHDMMADDWQVLD